MPKYKGMSGLGSRSGWVGKGGGVRGWGGDQGLSEGKAGKGITFEI